MSDLEDGPCEAFWSSVAGDLTSLQNYVDRDVRNVSAALTPLISRNVVSKWNDLKDAGACQCCDCRYSVEHL